jgi:hypothetical protein
MGPADRGDEEWDMVSAIKESLDVGEYSVDPQAVAAAMLARCAKPEKLGDLWSEVLIAPQPGRGDAGERQAFAGHDLA